MIVYIMFQVPDVKVPDVEWTQSQAKIDLQSYHKIMELPLKKAFPLPKLEIMIIACGEGGNNLRWWILTAPEGKL